MKLDIVKFLSLFRDFDGNGGIGSSMKTNFGKQCNLYFVENLYCSGICYRCTVKMLLQAWQYRITNTFTMNYLVVHEDA